MADPQLRLTVTRELWDAITKEVRPSFADSYLSGATVRGKYLTPHTVTAYRALKANRWAMRVLADQSLSLVEPLPFGHPDRPDSDLSP